VFLGIFIGAVTFTGSIVAFGKLRGKISSKPLSHHQQRQYLQAHAFGTHEDHQEHKRHHQRRQVQLTFI
jgi:NAD/NADP transhydrogenase beta subunit